MLTHLSRKVSKTCYEIWSQNNCVWSNVCELKFQTSEYLQECTEFSESELEGSNTTNRRDESVLTSNTLTCFDIVSVKEAWFDEAINDAPDLLFYS